MILLTGCQNGDYECQLTTLGYSMRLGGKNTGESNFASNTYKHFYRSLAKNFKSLNPDIFNSKNFSVISSFKVTHFYIDLDQNNIQARCISSARAFLSGLIDEAEQISSFEKDIDRSDYFGEELDYLDTKISINSRLMRFFDYCRKYIEYVDDHPRSIEEFNKFINGGHISNIRKKIQSKYQIQHLTNKQVRSRANCEKSLFVYSY